MRAKQNSHKIIPLPLGHATGEIERGKTDQGLVAPLNTIPAGSSAPTEFLTPFKRWREAMEVSRKTCGVSGDKIKALKERIEAGEYRVEPDAVAEKLLEHAIGELAGGTSSSDTNRCHRSHDQRRKPASL